MPRISVVIPNLNGVEDLTKCIDSLLAQSLNPHIIVVDNASTDGSLELLQSKYKNVEVIKNQVNRGFSGGVNPGIKRAIKKGDEYIALLNNDAVADKDWLKNLHSALSKNSRAGIATSKIIASNGKFLDSTGDFYTVWGLPFPRGRDEAELGKYDKKTEVFGASGGASLYRVEMLKEIGLFDEDFFAYYEDVDLSFRAQLTGWKIIYEPKAVAYHKIGATSSKMNGFVTQQTARNLPMLYLKNMPARLFWQNILRFMVAYWSIFFSSIFQGNGWPALKGLMQFLILVPRKLIERHRIQSKRRLSASNIDKLLVHDLPPNATKLRALQTMYCKITRRKHA